MCQSTTCHMPLSRCSKRQWDQWSVNLHPFTSPSQASCLHKNRAHARKSRCKIPESESCQAACLGIVNQQLQLLQPKPLDGLHLNFSICKNSELHLDTECPKCAIPRLRTPCLQTAPRCARSVQSASALGIAWPRASRQSPESWPRVPQCKPSPAKP